MTLLSRRVMVAALGARVAASLLAQQPDTGDPDWQELDGVTFQVSGSESDYALELEDCPDLDAQCMVVSSDGAIVYLTYTRDAEELRGKQVRFTGSLLVEFPAMSGAQLFMRVDRSAGVGFHEYAPKRPSRTRDWTSGELVGSVDEDAKSITVGLRFTGRGVAYFAMPKLEAAAD